MDGLCILLAIIHAGASNHSFDVRERFTLPEQSVAIFLIHSPDPEVRHRYAALAEEWYWQQFAAHWDARSWPWVDSFPELPWQGCEIPVAPGPDAAPPGQDWPGWRLATRLWARSQLAKGVEPAELERKLREAEARCAYWRVKGRYP